jgi:hypothetical protein
MVYEFDRYVGRQKKAEGCRIFTATDEADARRIAAELFRRDAPQSRFVLRKSDGGTGEDLTPPPPRAHKKCAPRSAGMLDRAGKLPVNGSPISDGDLMGRDVWESPAIHQRFSAGSESRRADFPHVD